MALLSKQQPAERLSAQVGWQHSALVNSGIDQTQLVIEDAPVGADSAFSFLVMGDTDVGHDEVGNGTSSDFADVFAKQINAHIANNRFLLHTGDVVYPCGSYQNYFSHFLQLYQPLLRNAPATPFYRGGDVTFTRPVLPVPGNHDYGSERSWLEGWSRVVRGVCDRLREKWNIDIGYYGGSGGEAYGQTFLDSLENLSAEQLKKHILSHYDGHYDGVASGGKNRCLSYRPGRFTRLPNRYYSFHYGGIDFFALDSNTWNSAPDTVGFDQGQLDWFVRSLIKSWQNPNAVGRVVYLHHSPYTTESTHWQKAETLWVRRHLRTALNRVATALKKSAIFSVENQRLTKNRQLCVPLVDVVLSGHAHCLEHLKSRQTGQGDAHIDWMICGGSGANLRRQRRGEADILESMTAQGRASTKIVAKSQLYVGKHGQRAKEKAFHSFVRVSVQPHQAQKLTVCPFVVTQIDGVWKTKALSPIPVGRKDLAASVASLDAVPPFSARTSG